MNIKSLKFSGLIIVVIFMAFVSCNKIPPSDKIEFKEDTTIFVGTWNWIYSDHYYNWCDPPSSYELLNPLNQSIEFKFEILKTGQFKSYRNEALISRYDLEISHFYIFENAQLQNSYIYGFYLNGNKNLYLSGLINSDTIMTNCFPGFIFKEEENGCGVYSNYFKKQ
ncbi:MAG: hypothetical protein JNJ99_12615 [Crocinitomicaceae bacterium]|nr:hypothetical protein [Crocinitomicaceae bacterium]